ncbi:MAG: hypothetical protein K2X02_04780 [Alphaproteobacteria bacterium]|nr:hypothetical protein [Alphaproteobacteria bacterium]
MKIVKRTAGAIIFFSHLNQVSCYNSQLLDSIADSFNERICVKAPISIKQIQENLSFLEDEDTLYISEYAKKNVFESYKLKIESRGNEFSTFYYNCKKIYDSNDIIDPVTQAAVQIMFERVFQKHEQHLNLLSSMSHLLPTKISFPLDSDLKGMTLGELLNPLDQ